MSHDWVAPGHLATVQPLVARGDVEPVELAAQLERQCPWGDGHTPVSVWASVRDEPLTNDPVPVAYG